jgi:hypothetical protein
LKFEVSRAERRHAGVEDDDRRADDAHVAFAQELPDAARDGRAAKGAIRRLGESRAGMAAAIDGAIAGEVNARGQVRVS